MKKTISLLMTAALFAAFNISAMGKSISVGYVLAVSYTHLTLPTKA